MKTHPSQDSLLKHALGTLEGDEGRRVSRHLGVCAACRRKVAQLEGEIAVLAGVRPELEIAPPPLPRKAAPVVTSWLRVAAMLAVGFLMGLFAGRLLQERPVEVVQQYLVPQPPSLPADMPVSCEPIDLALRGR